MIKIRKDINKIEFKKNRKKSTKPGAGSLKGQTKLTKLWPGSQEEKREDAIKENKK